MNKDDLEFHVISLMNNYNGVIIFAPMLIRTSSIFGFKTVKEYLIDRNLKEKTEEELRGEDYSDGMKNFYYTEEEAIEIVSKYRKLNFIKD